MSTIDTVARAVGIANTVYTAAGLQITPLKPFRGIKKTVPNSAVPTDTTSSNDTIVQLIADITVKENHHDELVITEHPIEQGAPVTDHSFLKQPDVTVRCAWSNSSPESGYDPTYIYLIYQKLRKMQSDRIPFQLFTGKRAYDNMLMQSLNVHTDQRTENILAVVLRCRQVFLVETKATVVSSNPAIQEDPGATMPNVDTGSKQRVPGTPNDGKLLIDWGDTFPSG